MSIIPCTICPRCKLINQFTVVRCECGMDLSQEKIQLMDTVIGIEQYGEIQEDLGYFIQKCIACGELNFIVDANKPASRCISCRRSVISNVKPLSYLSYLDSNFIGEVPDTADELKEEKNYDAAVWLHRLS